MLLVSKTLAPLAPKSDDPMGISVHMEGPRLKAGMQGAETPFIVLRASSLPLLCLRASNLQLLCPRLSSENRIKFWRYPAELRASQETPHTSSLANFALANFTPALANFSQALGDDRQTVAALMPPRAPRTMRVPSEVGLGAGVGLGHEKAVGKVLDWPDR